MTDVLSAVLALVQASGRVSGRVRAGGSWSMRLPAPLNPKFNAVVEGRCWLQTDALEAPVELAEGDAFLLVDSGSYVLSSDPALTPQDAGRYFAEAADGIAEIGTGRGTFLVGGQIEVDATSGPILLGQLPRVLILRSASVGDALRAALQALVREMESDEPGHVLLAEHLAQMVVVLFIRAHYATGGAHLPGWLRGLGDARIARAIGAIHREPARNWTVRLLADQAGMSRSSFAGVFARLVGSTPMAYASDWRLQLAASRLRKGASSVGAIAVESGYGSESALGAAFRRRFGTTPARFRRENRDPAKSLPLS